MEYRAMTPITRLPKMTVSLPDPVHQRLKIPIKLGPDRVAMCRRQHPQRSIHPRPVHHQLVPRPPVPGRLISQPLRDPLQPIRSHPRHMLQSPRSLLHQRQGNRQPRHKVHVRNIGEKLVIVQRKLAKRKVHIAVGIAWVQDGWLNQRGATSRSARIEHKLELFVSLAEPDTPAGDARNGDNGWVRAWRDGDGAIDGEGLEDFPRRRRGRKVGSSAVRLDEDAGHRGDG